MVTLNILRDSREQKPWSFEDFDATVRDETIRTADYTLSEFCDHDEDNDTYYPNFAVERKSGDDFITSITSSRDRFREEIKRASDWDFPLYVVIEEPKLTFRRQQGFMRFRDVGPQEIFGTISKWEKYYNVNFQFSGNRERAQRKAYNLLSSQLRSTLVSG